MFEKVTIKTLNPNGWPIDFELSPEKGKTAEAIAFLEKHGYKPAPTAADSRDFLALPDGSFLCPKHGAVMRKREKQGDTWYSHAVEDGDGQKHYCRGYRSKNSPGFDLE